MQSFVGFFTRGIVTDGKLVNEEGSVNTIDLAS
jgi:hypothetical protein